MKKVTIILDEGQADLAADACEEAGRSCDKAVGGKSRSGDAFREIAEKIRRELI